MICQKIVINIFERDKIAVSGCKVIFMNKQRRYTCLSDKSGICQMNLPLGKYIIIIAKNNYQTRINIIFLKRGIYFLRLRIYSISENIVFGRIVDKYNRPIDEASVILFKDDIPIASVTSNSDGLYYFKNMHQGKYYVIAWKDEQD